jgi:hypothetical protein
MSLSRKARLVGSLWLCAGSVAVASSAKANPRPLPFSYPYATLPGGSAELEQFVDLTWVRSLDESGATVWSPGSMLTTELEYGLSDRAELGLYLQLSQSPNTGSGGSGLQFDGIKQRLRVRLAEAGQWPVNIALYAEVAELRSEIELEGKIILERRFGNWQLVSNLWAEHEFYFSGRREWVLHPTAGVTYQFSPAFVTGLEYWMSLEIDARHPGWPQAFNPSAQHYLGPTVMVQRSRFWWSTGVYLRMSDWNRGSQLGDSFGRFWIRTVLGIDMPD